MRIEISSEDIQRLGGFLGELSGALLLLPVARGTILAARVVRNHARTSADFHDRPRGEREKAFRRLGVSVPRPLRKSIAARPQSVRVQVGRARPDGSIYFINRRERASANVVTTGARKRAPNTPRYGYIVEAGGRTGRNRGRGYLRSAFDATTGQQGRAFFQGAAQELARVQAELAAPRESVRVKTRKLQRYRQLHLV